MTLPRNEPIYQRRKPAPSPQQVLAATPALPTEKQTREGAMRVAQCIQNAKPHKVIVVFNLFGTHRWFVRSFKEPDLRQFLAESKQTRPIRKQKEQL